ncbi:hypothetical protein BDFB_004346, partial [Asbolus verrucosus]
IRRRPNFRQLSDYARSRVVGLREIGLSFRQIQIVIELGPKKAENTEPDAQGVLDRQRHVRSAV